MTATRSVRGCVCCGEGGVCVSEWVEGSQAIQMELMEHCNQAKAHPELTNKVCVGMGGRQLGLWSTSTSA